MRNARAPATKQNKKYEEAVGALVRDIVSAVNRVSAHLAPLSGTERDAVMRTCASVMAAVMRVLQTRAAELEYEERKKQAERAKKPRLQPAILAAAQYYRSDKKIAKEAWNLIRKKPFGTSTGETVEIEGGMMHVHVGTRRGRGIKEPQWQKRYWPAAKPS